MRRAVVIGACASASLLACSGDFATGRRCSDDSTTCATPDTPRITGGSAGAPGGSAGKGNHASATGTSGGIVVGDDSALTVHVEDIRKMTIEIVTLTCAGDCVDIQAVAHGGNPPYTFAWDDGTTNAQRHACLNASAQLSVTATDTTITDDEFSYTARSVSADVTANVLDCSDAGVPPSAGEFCIKNPSIEGTPQAGETGFAPDWTECVLSPNIEPFFSTIPATDGATYLGEEDAIQDVLNEGSGAVFCSPLEPGKSISFLVDIGIGSFNPNAGQLELWGGSTSCDKDELLWTSPVVSDVDTWHTFCGTLTPSKAYEYLMLWPVQAAGAASYVIVDNFRPTDSCD